MINQSSQNQTKRGDRPTLLQEYEKVRSSQAYQLRQFAEWITYNLRAGYTPERFQRMLDGVEEICCKFHLGTLPVSSPATKSTVAEEKQ